MPKKITNLVIASTTSTQNSGLLDMLIPAFEKAACSSVKVHVIAVGTGQAMRIAKKGDADLLFVHDPFREEKFIAEGYGVNRRQVMHNDFVILGPPTDPARIRGHQGAIDAFELIAEMGAPFVSRGDDSGTNTRELDLWDDAGVNPRGKGWYLEAGADMGETLLMADRKRAYTVSDRGTYMNYRRRLSLVVLVEGDQLLRNQYSVIAVNPAKYPRVRYREAMEFIAFVTSPEGQAIIARYRKQGVPLFNPDAVPIRPSGNRRSGTRRRVR